MLISTFDNRAQVMGVEVGSVVDRADSVSIPRNCLDGVLTPAGGRKITLL